MIKDIRNNTLIICENDYKNKILKYLSANKFFLNVKFMTKKEFFQEYLFNYNEKTISYLVNSYNYKVDIAKMYLDNLYYIEEYSYKSSKLNFLSKLKQELKDKNLLIFNDNFQNFLNKYHILVVGYPYLENYELKIFNELDAKIENDTASYQVKNVYEFKNMEEEINFVCKSISKLILNNIPINQIKIVGIDKDYDNDIKRIFKFYNIPIKISKGETLYSYKTIKKFLDNIDNGLDSAIASIKDENIDLRKKVINICNKYVYEEDIEKIKPLLINDLKNTYYDNFKLKNYIEVVDLFSPITDDEYVFVMNFNEGVIPKYFKDEEYIADNIKEEIDLNKTSVKNKIYKSSTINKLKSIKNLVITYKLKSNMKEYYPSSLVNTLNLNIIHPEDDILNSYSLINDKIRYAKMQDDYFKYGNIQQDYYIYQQTLKDNSYNTYDNKFKGIDNKLLKDYLKGKLNLSYTSINNYYKCAYRFYLANILKLDKYEENFDAFIGSLFHSVLEKCFINKLDVDSEIEKYIKESNKELNVKERFFINIIKEDIKFVISVLNKQNEEIELTDSYYEKNIVISKNNDLEVYFSGIIDKILYKVVDDTELVTIVDYKTGNADNSLLYLPYGLSLQLPIYLYLVSNSGIFKNPKFIGFYLQHILDKDIKRDIKKNYLEERFSNLKLDGFSNKDIHSLVMLDKSYQNSTLIKGLKVKGDGEFFSTAKVLNDEEINKIIKLTENKIEEAIDKILNGEFVINPKKIGYDKDMGCLYCKFKDICFKKEDNYEILKEIKDLSFLENIK